MNWIEQLLRAVLHWLTQLAREDKTAQDAQPQDQLRDELRDRIDAHERGLRDPGDSGPER